MPILKFENIKPKNFYKSDNYQGYSINYIRQLNSLIVYGVLSTSDIYLFSLSKKQWSLIKTSGKKPSFRRFYAHYYHDTLKALIINGGQIIQKNKKPKSSDQSYILFITNWQWRKIFLKQSFTCRQFHQIIPIQIKANKKQLLIFGGFSKPYQTVLNDLWSLNNLQNLSIKSNKHQVHGSEIQNIQTKGNAPYLYGYSNLKINNHILFFGGQHKIKNKKFQIFILNLQIFQWQRINISNKVCPSLIFPKVYFSAIDNQNIHIFGGINLQTQKANKICYLLDLRKMQIFQSQQSKIFNSIQDNEQSQHMLDRYSANCCITQNPLCIANIQHNQNLDQEVQIKILYQKGSNQQSRNSHNNNIQIDQPQQQSQIQSLQAPQHQISIQQSLKAIKHQQILSQQLIKKNYILQQLYKQIQRYISLLYSNYYLNLPGQYINEQIQKQKQKNIRNCQQLKISYLQNQKQYEYIVKKIKELRGQLGEIHEDFQRCIQTEIDQEEENNL